MYNELIVKKSWRQRHWKWLILIFLFVLLLFMIVPAIVSGNFKDIAQVYSDDTLYQKAIEKAKTNKRVLEVIGNIEPIDKLAIMEGNIVYSNNNSNVKLSVRVNGNKGKGKMDVTAYKVGTEWQYTNISIRIKNPKEVIEIVKDTVVLK